MTGPGEATRKRIVMAAVETLKQEGFAGTSARAVARTGGFNQALVFYHFGSMTELLLAASTRPRPGAWTGTARLSPVSQTCRAWWSWRGASTRRTSTPAT